MHSEATTTSKINDPLISLGNNHLDTTNITVAIVSSAPQQQQQHHHLSSSLTSLHTTSPQINELASSSTTQSFPLVLPNNTTKIIINNNTQINKPKVVNQNVHSSLTASENSKSTVIVPGCHTIISEGSTLYDTAQLILTPNVMPVKHNYDQSSISSILQSDKKSSDYCEITAMKDTSTEVELSANLTNLSDSSSALLGNATNSTSNVEFEIVRDNNSTNDEEEGKHTFDLDTFNIK